MNSEVYLLEEKTHLIISKESLDAVGIQHQMIHGIRGGSGSK